MQTKLGMIFGMINYSMNKTMNKLAPNHQPHLVAEHRTHINTQKHTGQGQPRRVSTPLTSQSKTRCAHTPVTPCHPYPSHLVDASAPKRALLTEGAPAAFFLNGPCGRSLLLPLGFLGFISAALAASSSTMSSSSAASVHEKDTCREKRVIQEASKQ